MTDSPGELQTCCEAVYSWPLVHVGQMNALLRAARLGEATRRFFALHRIAPIYIKQRGPGLAEAGRHVHAVAAS